MNGFVNTNVEAAGSPKRISEIYGDSILVNLTKSKVETNTNGEFNFVSIHTELVTLPMTLFKKAARDSKQTTK